MKAYILGARPSIDLNTVRSLDARFEQTGRNTGNQMIGFGIYSVLDYEQVSWDFRLSAKEVAEKFDVVIIAAANFLHSSFDFGWMANFIEETKLPCMMVGLGAQSNDYSTNIDLKPGTERMIRIVAERSNLIGVRGSFTASVLSAMGIHNYQVTGCPSYYMSGKGEIEFNENKIILNKNPKIALNLSRDVIRHSFDQKHMKHAIFSCVSSAVKYKADFIAQTEREEMELAMHGPVQKREALDSLANFYSGVADREDFMCWASAHMRVYWSVPEWLEAMSRYDFVFGQRFHGNMAAIQAGTPAVFICHDTRTTEMCEFLGMPFVKIDDIETIDINNLFELFDAGKIKKRYSELFPVYRKFLEANGIKHKLGL